MVFNYLIDLIGKTLYIIQLAVGSIVSMYNNNNNNDNNNNNNNNNKCILYNAFQVLKDALQVKTEV